MSRALRPLKRWFSRWNRRRKVDRLQRFVAEHAVSSAIVVGVGRRRFANEGMVEDGVAAVTRVVAACDIRPRVSPWPAVVCDGRALPFRDGAADLVVSNAVIEHVGGEDDQCRLLSEQARVGRWWVATTPNLWFPVESHTSVPLLHWSARWRAARCQVFTNLLDRRRFAALLPDGGRLEGRASSPTLLAWGRGGGALTTPEPEDGPGRSPDAHP